jgi:anti-sigma B factor antagonist
MRGRGRKVARSAGPAPEEGAMLDCPVMDLDVETARHGDVAVLTVRGEIDVYTAPRLRQAIVDLVDAGSARIVVDMERVDFLDSTGLGVLVEGLKRARNRDGELSIVTSQDKILRIFDITGLNKTFSIHPSVEEGVAAVGRSG